MHAFCERLYAKADGLQAIKHDISIYFEANGHGTIYFGEGLQRRLADLQSQLDEQSDLARALTDLTATVKLVNQAVGDGFSNLLLIESILARKSISMAQWMGLYRDLPSRQSKVQVPDRRKVCLNSTRWICKHYNVLFLFFRYLVSGGKHVCFNHSHR